MFVGFFENFVEFCRSTTLIVRALPDHCKDPIMAKFFAPHAFFVPFLKISVFGDKCTFRKSKGDSGFFFFENFIRALSVL